MNLPKVSIIITAYLEESKPYLDACVQSVKALNYDQTALEVIIVTPRWYVPEYEGCKTVHPAYGAYHNALAVNFGMDLASKDSKYLLLLNDDVIMTRNSLIKMVNIAGDNNVVLGCMSNCDNGGFYDVDFPLGLNKRQYRYEEIKNLIPQMIEADLPTGPLRLIRPNTLYLYCNLFPRKVWDSVTGGTAPNDIGFDTSFLTSWDDTDWMMRAQRAGVVAVIVADALAFHCSGASADTTMKDLKSDLRKEAEAIFRRKWNM